MREIIFRGKRVDNNEWVYGSLVSYPNNVYEILKLEMGRCCLSTEHSKVIPETIGEYTGLKDKNGKKIFEGDLVKHMYETKPYTVHFKEDRCGFSPFANDGGCGCCCDFDYTGVEDIEVIGTIYDGDNNA